jgi:hypothetical protein
MVPLAQPWPPRNHEGHTALESTVFGNVPGRHPHQYHDVMSSKSFLSFAAGFLVSARNG